MRRPASFVVTIALGVLAPACKKEQTSSTPPPTEVVATVKDLEERGVDITLDGQRGIALAFSRGGDGSPCLKITDAIEITHEHKDDPKLNDAFVITQAGGIQKFAQGNDGPGCGKLSATTKNEHGNAGKDSRIVFRNKGSKDVVTEIDLSAVLSAERKLVVQDHTESPPKLTAGEKVTFLLDADPIAEWPEPDLLGNTIIGNFPTDPHPHFCLLGRTPGDTTNSEPAKHCQTPVSFSKTNLVGIGRIREKKLIDVRLPVNMKPGPTELNFDWGGVNRSRKLACAFKLCTVYPPPAEWLKVEIEAAPDAGAGGADAGKSVGAADSGTKGRDGGR